MITAAIPPPCRLATNTVYIWIAPKPSVLIAAPMTDTTFKALATKFFKEFLIFSKNLALTNKISAIMAKKNTTNIVLTSMTILEGQELFNFLV